MSEINQYKSMFEAAVLPLAAIDNALGIEDDGCADPERTLDAISELQTVAKLGASLAHTVMADSFGSA